MVYADEVVVPGASLLRMYSFPTVICRHETTSANTAPEADQSIPLTPAMLSVPYALIASVRAVTWVVKALVSESISSEMCGQPHGSG